MQKILLQERISSAIILEMGTEASVFSRLQGAPTHYPTRVGAPCRREQLKREIADVIRSYSRLPASVGTLSVRVSSFR